MVLKALTASLGRVNLKDITRDMLRQRVIVEAVVADIVEKPSKTRERIHIYTLSQDEKHIEVVWWEEFAKRLSVEQTPKNGDRVRIRGQVDEYRGNLQLRPAGPRDVVEVEPDFRLQPTAGNGCGFFCRPTPPARTQ